jgi:hypothetical protein
MKGRGEEEERRRRRRKAEYRAILQLICTAEFMLIVGWLYSEDNPTIG